MGGAREREGRRRGLRERKGKEKEEREGGEKRRWNMLNLGQKLLTGSSNGVCLSTLSVFVKSVFISSCHNSLCVLVVQYLTVKVHLKHRLQCQCESCWGGHISTLILQWVAWRS